MMATTFRPFASYSFVNFANSPRTCFTNGQCLQMKATSSALPPFTSASLTVFPSKSGSENDGSGVPRSSMVDGVSGMEAPRNPDYIDSRVSTALLGDADRVSRVDQQHGVRERRLRVARIESDGESVGRHLQGQPAVGARDAGG